MNEDQTTRAARSIPSLSIVCLNPVEGSALRRHIDSAITAVSNVPGNLHFEHLILSKKLPPEVKVVLREAPHIIWSEEEASTDNLSLHSAQTLFELGARRATGDFLIFLKDEDTLHEDGLRHAFGEMGEKDFLIGHCLVKQNLEIPGSAENDVLKNTCRNWHDVLKYWVQGSTPLLSGLVIRRSLLLSLLTPSAENSILNSPSDSVRDYHLFLELLRPLRGHPATAEPQVWKGGFAPFLLSQRNTATTPLSSFHEQLPSALARSYRRSMNSSTLQERCISVVIRTNGVTNALETTLQSCSRQTFQDFEILTVESSENAQSALEVAQFIHQLQEIAKDARYRNFPHPGSSSYYQSLRTWVSELASPLVLLLQAGDVLRESALLEIINHFQQDSLGALLLCGGSPEEHEHLHTALEGESLFNIQSLFGKGHIPCSAAFRKVTLQEILQVNFSSDNGIALRQLYLTTQYKAWSIKPAFHLFHSTTSSSSSWSPDDLEPEDHYLQATLIDFLARVRERDPFAQERRATGLIIEFDDDTVSAARSYLALQEKS